MRPVLLDTCAMLFVAEQQPIRDEAKEAMIEAIAAAQIYLSPITAWEIGIATAKGKLKLPVAPLRYYHDFLGQEGISTCELGPEILVAASYLPGDLHRDPMDRLLVATARHFDYTLITRDRAILAYGGDGHVKTLAC